MTSHKNKLTQKQAAFVRHYVKNGNASAAYRHAYSADNMKPATVWTEACKTMKVPQVAARIHEMNRQIDETSALNGDRLRERVRAGLLREAEQGDTSASRIAALKALGELSDVQAFAAQRIETKQTITSDSARQNLETAVSKALNDPSIVQLFEK